MLTCQTASGEKLSPFYKRFEPQQRIFPLLRDRVERSAGFVDRAGLEFKDLLTALADMPDQASVAEDAKVLGDCLAGEPGASGEARD